VWPCGSLSFSFAASYGLGLTGRAAWRWICRWHGQADRTLAPSSWAIDALRDRGVPGVRRRARGVDTRRFTPSRRDPDLRAALAPHGELLVGYVGRLAPEKQLDRLGVLSADPGVRLVLVGDGPDAGRLHELLPAATFLGFRGGDELAGSTPRSTCSCTPDRPRRSARPCRRRWRRACRW
jgi:phosphatidylinositol alpha 1,6-mannosyltransferase